MIAGLWGTGVYLAHSNGYLPFLDRVESALVDIRTLLRGVKAAPDLVTIVAIDDSIVKRGGTYPLARAVLAKLIETVARLEPKVIAVDLLLLDRGSADGDAALAKSLALRPTVLAAAAVFPQTTQPVPSDSEGSLGALPRAEQFLVPLATFTERAEIGIVNVTTGQAGTPQWVPMLFRTNDKIELSFPLRVAAVAIGSPLTIEPNRLVFGDRSIATDAGYTLPIAYYGPRRTIRTVSAGSVMDGQLGREAIQDRVVVLGATVTGGGDFFPSPFDSLMPGVEIISTAITNLLAGDGLLRDRSVRLLDAVAMILLPMLLVGLLAWRQSAIGLIATSAVVLAWAAGNAFAFNHGIWLNAATTIAAAAPPLVVFGAMQLWSGRRSARYYAEKSSLLGQFQAPGVQEWLARDHKFLLKPVRQDAAIVFVDISGFTSLSERLDPDAIRELLKDFHALVDREVIRCGGMITGFLGDGAMILFGLPRPAADDAGRAAECSVGLCIGAERWIGSLPPSIAADIGFKIGAHFGPIVASRLGGGSHQHITATGDTVNVASRLMEVAANRGARLALSDRLLEQAGPDCKPRSSGSLAGPFDTQIRGRSGELSVWLWRNEVKAAGAQAQRDTAG
jgi:adenylate cyclase